MIKTSSVSFAYVRIQNETDTEKVHQREAGHEASIILNGVCLT